MVERLERRALIEAARDGSREAFAELVALEKARIRALVVSRLRARIVLEVDPDDVYQETLLRAFKSIRGFQWRGDETADPLLPWIGGIAENVILELARKWARERRALLEVDPPAQAISASRTLRREERLQRLEESLGALSPDHRQVILLTRIEKLTIPEAAKRMGRSPDAVKQLLYRALKELKSRFGDTESLHLPPRGLGEGRGDARGR